jgi:hypothetical protein
VCGIKKERQMKKVFTPGWRSVTIPTLLALCAWIYVCVQAMVVVQGPITISLNDLQNRLAGILSTLSNDQRHIEQLQLQTRKDALVVTVTFKEEYPDLRLQGSVDIEGMLQYGEAWNRFSFKYERDEDADSLIKYYAAVIAANFRKISAADLHDGISGGYLNHVEVSGDTVVLSWSPSERIFSVSILLASILGIYGFVRALAWACMHHISTCDD